MDPGGRDPGGCGLTSEAVAIAVVVDPVAGHLDRVGVNDRPGVVAVGGVDDPRPRRAAVRALGEGAVGVAEPVAVLVRVLSPPEEPR